MGGPSSPARSDSDNSTITEQTSNARSSRKSNRERALEEENASLKTQMADLTTSFNARMAEMQSKYKKEISDLHSKLEQILQQTTQKDSPNRKKQDTKASPSKFPFPKPATRTATRPGTS